MSTIRMVGGEQLDLLALIDPGDVPLQNPEDAARADATAWYLAPWRVGQIAQARTSAALAAVRSDIISTRYGALNGAWSWETRTDGVTFTSTPYGPLHISWRDMFFLVRARLTGPAGEAVHAAQRELVEHHRSYPHFAWDHRRPIEEYADEHAHWQATVYDPWRARREDLLAELERAVQVVLPRSEWGA